MTVVDASQYGTVFTKELTDTLRDITVHGKGQTTVYLKQGGV